MGVFGLRMSIGRGRGLGLLGVGLAVAALLLVVVPTTANAGAAKKTTGVVYAAATHVEDDDLYVAGDLKDSLLGRGAIVYKTQISDGGNGSLLVKAREITIYTKRGSLTGKGEAIQTFNDDGTATISDGTFKLKRGTGAYKGHGMKGTFDGVYEDGVFTFDYEARYR